MLELKMRMDQMKRHNENLRAELAWWRSWFWQEQAAARHDGSAQGVWKQPETLNKDNITDVPGEGKFGDEASGHIYKKGLSMRIRRKVVQM